MRGLAAVARAENIAIAASERLWSPARRWCICCGWQGLSFRTLAVAGYLRHGAVCPRCGSFERHRALAGFLGAAFDPIQVDMVSAERRYAADSLRPAEEVGGDFASEAQRLGEAVGRVHALLAEHFPVVERTASDHASRACSNLTADHTTNANSIVTASTIADQRASSARRSTG